MQPFTLTVHSFTPPTVPPQPAGLQHTDIQSPLISIVPVTSPLRFTLALPSARDNNSLFPATHLQLSYVFACTGEIFDPEVLTAETIRSPRSQGTGEAEQKLYDVMIEPSRIPRAKVNSGESPDAEVIVYAWKREKFLGKFVLGRIEGLGFVGLKEHELAKRRVEQWNKTRALADRSRAVVVS